MEWNIKLKLIGYYTGEKQNMYPEKRFVEEASKLNDLLGQTFQLTFEPLPAEINEHTADFIKSLSENSVYIFKDEDKNLYAWFKAKGIARISQVVYDKQSILPIPEEYTSWFVLGSRIELKERSQEKKHKFVDNEIALFGVDDVKHVYQDKDLMIKQAGSDYLIFLKDNMFALSRRNKSHIKVEELRRLILHRWSYLQEFTSSDLCANENCDGWDYSHCDMDRCRNNCDGCGGRRYKCDNRCQFNRYNNFVQIWCYGNINEELEDVSKIIDMIIKPHSDYKELINQHDRVLRSYYKECSSYPISDKALKKYCRKYKKMREKVSFRELPEKDYVKVIINENGKRNEYIVPKSAVQIENAGCLAFWTPDFFIVCGYDKIKDDYISYSASLKFVKGVNGNEFRKRITAQDFNEIVINIIDKKIQYTFA